jgi:1,5-anhydro-D-fructose reductase (1,5-anhydro-D-mannitol-forming)
MKQGKIRFGIIGFGAFAERAIAPALQNSSKAELVAIQKRSLSEARSKAQQYAVPHAFDEPEMLVAHPDVEAVFIVSANAKHCDETIAAARAGKHVLVEKPMAINHREAEIMIDACANAGVKLMVGHMIRFSPLVERIRGLIHEGAIGTVTCARSDFYFQGSGSPRAWLFDRAVAGGGPVFDIGVHCLDTLRYILNDEVASVSAELAPLPTPTRTEDSAQIALKFSRGTIGSIYCSFVAPVRRSFLRVVGTTGILSAEDFTLGSKTLELVYQRGTDGRLTGEDTERIDVPNLYVQEIAHFSDCILTGAEPESSGLNGLRNQRVLDAVYEPGGKIR